MVRRAAGLTRAPLKVGFPGGRVEPGETQRQAVVREAREELDLEVIPLRCVWRYYWSIRPPTHSWMLWAWLAEMTTTTLRPRAEEIAEVIWLTPEEGMAHPDALPTMRPLCEILQHLRR